ncbi:MAG: ABC transporter substrate-binding protein [Euzebyales bacterium]|jgi:branched-chain amino acid transport system substrate-binding protein|nr:ABC transporter substrate-binding protein [Euzebyales bacterium]
MTRSSFRWIGATLTVLLLLLAGCAESDDAADPGATGPAGEATVAGTGVPGGDGTATAGAATEAGEATDTEGATDTSGEEGPIRMGAVLDITGPGANLGGPERDTLQLLAEQINAAGGVDGREVELDIRDNQSREDEAATQLTSLLQEEVDIILGASRTGPSLAMRPLAEQAAIPMISLAANQAIVDGSEWVFKTAQNDRVVVEKIVAYMQTQDWQTLGLVRDASAFGEGVADLFRDVSGDADIVAVEERFATDATEFTAQMLSLRSAGADVNVIWGIPPAAATATQAYRDLGLDIPLMHSHGIGNQVFLEVAGPAAEGVVFPIGRLLVADELGDDDPQKEVITTFVADYADAYGAPPSTFAGHAYDAFQLAVQAFGEVGTDPAAVRDYLETAELTGISGVFRMTPEDHSGLTSDALVIVEVADGDWTLAADQPDGS